MNYNNIDWGVVYNALIHSITSKSGLGFYNCDSGQIVYQDGQEGGQGDDTDGPDRNDLYKALREISLNHKLPEGLPRITTWQEFCKFAYDNRDT